MLINEEVEAKVRCRPEWDKHYKNLLIYYHNGVLSLEPMGAREIEWTKHMEKGVELRDG